MMHYNVSFSDLVFLERKALEFAYWSIPYCGMESKGRFVHTFRIGNSYTGSFTTSNRYSKSQDAQSANNNINEEGVSHEQLKKLLDRRLTSDGARSLSSTTLNCGGLVGTHFALPNAALANTHTTSYIALCNDSGG